MREEEEVVSLEEAFKKGSVNSRGSGSVQRHDPETITPPAPEPPPTPPGPPAVDELDETTLTEWQRDFLASMTPAQRAAFDALQLDPALPSEAELARLSPGSRLGKIMQAQGCARRGILGFFLAGPDRVIATEILDRLTPRSPSPPEPAREATVEELLLALPTGSPGLVARATDTLMRDLGDHQGSWPFFHGLLQDVRAGTRDVNTILEPYRKMREKIASGHKIRNRGAYMTQSITNGATGDTLFSFGRGREGGS